MLKENIEKFDEYEYMVDTDEASKPIWVKGREGLNLQKRNQENLIMV